MFIPHLRIEFDMTPTLRALLCKQEEADPQIFVNATLF